MSRTSTVMASVAALVLVAHSAAPAQAQLKRFSNRSNTTSQNSNSGSKLQIQKFTPVTNGQTSNQGHSLKLQGLPQNLNSTKNFQKFNPGTNLQGIRRQDLKVTNPIVNQIKDLNKKHIPIDPGFNGNGKGNGGKLDKHHQDFWCKQQPKHCHWWFNYCPSLQTCKPGVYHTINWHHCHPTVYVDGLPIISTTNWYFGLNGMILAGKGIGVQSVEPGSPAALANLQPGMILTSANGIPLVDADAMNLAIIRSGGVLRIEVLVTADAAPQLVQIQLVPVQTASF